MKRLNYSKKMEELIIKHEEYMLSSYMKQVKEYISLFEEKGCALKVGLMWKKFPSNITQFQREKFANGYECYIYCVVEKNGEEVYVKSDNEEIDFFSLSTTCMVSSIYRSFFSLKISLYSDMDELNNDLNNFLLQL